MASFRRLAVDLAESFGAWCEARHECGVEDAGELKVVDVAGLGLDEAGILHSSDMSSDEP
jgi:hypothetical protein